MLSIYINLNFCWKFMKVPELEFGPLAVFGHDFRFRFWASTFPSEGRRGASLPYGARNENLFGKSMSEINQIKLITPSFCRWWHWLRISLMIETCHLTAILCFQVMDSTEQGRKDRNRSAKVALHVEERLFSSKSHSSCLELSPFSEVFTSERLVLGGPMAQSTAKRPKRDCKVDTCNNILMQW